VNWTLTRRLPDGTREEIEPEKLWAEHDALAARDRELAEARVQAGDWCDAEALQRVRAETAERALAEARGPLEHIARCRDEHHAHDAGWLERCFPLAARPAPACESPMCGWPACKGICAELQPGVSPPSRLDATYIEGVRALDTRAEPPAPPAPEDK